MKCGDLRGEVSEPKGLGDRLGKIRAHSMAPNASKRCKHTPTTSSAGSRQETTPSRF